MNTILKSAKPDELIVVSNVRTKPPMPNGQIDPDLAELVESVRMFGVMQPITVRREGSKLRVIYGHRRAEAAKLAKLPAVPIIVQDVPDEEIVARQLIENIQRQALDLADTAAGVHALYVEHGVTAVVAEMLGKSTSWVSKMLTVTAPGKSTNAQHLLKWDRLHDLELAYLLCRVETLSVAAANDLAHKIFHNIEPVTRETVKAKLAELEDKVRKQSLGEDSSPPMDARLGTPTPTQEEPPTSVAPTWRDLADLVKMVLDDIDICIGELGSDWDPTDLSTETVKALATFRKRHPAFS